MYQIINFFEKNNKIKLLCTKSYKDFLFSIEWLFPFDKIENKIDLLIKENKTKKIIIVYPQILEKFFLNYFILFQTKIKLKYFDIEIEILDIQNLFIKYFYDLNFFVDLNNMFFFFIYSDFFFLDYSYYMDFFINTKSNNDSLLLLNEEIINSLKQKKVNAVLKTSEHIKNLFELDKVTDQNSIIKIIDNNFDIKNNDFINIFSFLNILDKDQFILYSECVSHKKYESFLKSFYFNQHILKKEKIDVFISNYLPNNNIQISNIVFSKNKEEQNRFYLFKNKYNIDININDFEKNTLYLNIVIDNYNELTFGDLLMLSKIIKNKIKIEKKIFVKKIVFIVNSKKNLLSIIKNNRIIRKSLIPLLKNKKNFLIDIFLYESKYPSIDLDFINYRLKILNIDIKFFKIFYKLKILLLTNYDKLLEIVNLYKEKLLKDNNIENVCRDLVQEIFKIKNEKTKIKDNIKIVFEIFYVFKALFIEHKQYQEKNILLFGKSKDGYLNYIKSLNETFCFLLKDFFLSLDKIHLNKTKNINITNVDVKDSLLEDI